MKDILTLASDKLQEQYKADLAVKVIQCLEKKGWQFDTREGLFEFFKNRIKSNFHEGITTYSLDGVEFCASKEPVFEQRKGKKKGKTDVNIGFEFIEL